MHVWFCIFRTIFRPQSPPVAFCEASLTELPACCLGCIRERDCHMSNAHAAEADRQPANRHETTVTSRTSRLFIHLRRLYQNSLSSRGLRRSTAFDPLHLQQHDREVRALVRGLSATSMLQYRQQRRRQRHMQQTTAQEQEAALSLIQTVQQQGTRVAAAAAARRLEQMAAAAVAAVPTPVQDEHCDTDAQQSQLWSPGSADEYADMPSLINASPAQLNSSLYGAWGPPSMSPERNFLTEPPQDSSEHPVQMELDGSDDERMPPLVNVDVDEDQVIADWLQPGTSWREQGQQEDQQQQQQQQLSLQAEELRFGLRFDSLTGQMTTPPHAVSARARLAARRMTGPAAVRPARSTGVEAGVTSAQPPRNRRHIDALYASAVQEVWARTTRRSVDLLLGYDPNDSGAQEQQPLLRPSFQQQQQQEQQEYVQLQQVQQVPLAPELCTPPAACSFLQPGLSFVGSQKLLQRGSFRREDQWAVRVVLHDVDYSRGRVSGSMRALDVAGAAGPIDTYWEGDIIDDVHNIFWTQTWGASRETDLRHWSKFDGFADIKPLVIKHGGRCGQLQQHPTIFMRWKEQFFVNAKEECGLTIAGFYYLALERSSGRVRGLYFDPNSSPFQELNLQVEHGVAASTRSSRCSSDTDTSGNQGGSQSQHSSGSSSGCRNSSGRGVSFGSYSFA